MEIISIFCDKCGKSLAIQTTTSFQFIDTKIIKQVMEQINQKETIIVCPVCGEKKSFKLKVGEEEWR